MNIQNSSDNQGIQHIPKMPPTWLFFVLISCHFPCSRFVWNVRGNFCHQKYTMPPNGLSLTDRDTNCWEDGFDHKSCVEKGHLSWTSSLVIQLNSMLPFVWLFDFFQWNIVTENMNIPSDKTRAICLKTRSCWQDYSYLKIT